MTKNLDEFLDRSAAIRRVRGAMNMVGCAPWEFFLRATHFENMTETFDAEVEAKKFEQFETHGPAVNANYEVPRHIRHFAGTIHARRDPCTFFESLRISHQPRVQASM